VVLDGVSFEKEKGLLKNNEKLANNIVEIGTTPVLRGPGCHQQGTQNFYLISDGYLILKCLKNIVSHSSPPRCVVSAT